MTTVGVASRLRSARRAASVVIVLVLTSCGGGAGNTSSTVAAGPAATRPADDVTPTSAPRGTTDITATGVDMVEATAAPLVTAPLVTGTPAETTSPPAATSPSASGALVNGPATAFAIANDQLVEIDATTGETIRVLDEAFTGGGVFRGGLRLSPDRGTLWFDEGYEDGWFDCESSAGAFGSVDVATGDLQLLGSGFGVSPSPDGSTIAYVGSDVCLPDPTNPEVYVLTPADRVVVRDLATGDEQVFVTDTPPDADRSPSIVLAAVFGPDGTVFASLVDGRVFEIDLDGPGIIQQHPVVLTGSTGTLVAATTAGLVSIVTGDEGSNDLYITDPVTGDRQLLASSELYMPVGVSADGEIAVSSADLVTVPPGAAVAVIAPPGDPFVYDVDW